MAPAKTPAGIPAGAQANQAGSEEQQRAAEGAVGPLGVGEPVHVDAGCLERSGGDARVRLSRLLSAPPKGSTAHLAHPAHNDLEGKMCFLRGSLPKPAECITVTPVCHAVHIWSWGSPVNDDRLIKAVMQC